MPTFADYGTPFVVTATGTQVVTSANAAIIGMCFQGSATGGITLFQGVTSTATGAVSNLIRFYVTVAATVVAPVYLPYPAVCPGGITLVMQASADPKLTLFWNPTGGA